MKFFKLWLSNERTLTKAHTCFSTSVRRCNDVVENAGKQENQLFWDTERRKSIKRCSNQLTAALHVVKQTERTVLSQERGRLYHHPEVGRATGLLAKMFSLKLGKTWAWQRVISQRSKGVRVISCWTPEPGTCMFSVRCDREIRRRVRAKVRMHATVRLLSCIRGAIGANLSVRNYHKHAAVNCT